MPQRKRKKRGGKKPHPLSTGPIWRCQLVREQSALAIPTKFACAADIHASSKSYMTNLPQEEFWALFCDVKNGVRGASMISRGILDSSLVHPREVFRPAILASAASVVLMHNHPSGDPEPSPEDRALTDRLVKAGTLLGVPVLDHVVFGERGFVSFAERGWV